MNKKKNKKKVSAFCAKCWGRGCMTSTYTDLTTSNKYPMCSKCGHIDKRS